MKKRIYIYIADLIIKFFRLYNEGADDYDQMIVRLESFLKPIVVDFLSADLQLNPSELTSWQTQYGHNQVRLGTTRLAALELLELLSYKLGTRVRCWFPECNMFHLLLSYYKVFPFNDLALQ